MNHYIPEDIFEDFTGRDNDLRGVKRYSIYKVMLYRSNLYTHSYRVAAIIREINPMASEVFGKSYDPIKAEVMGLVHDDAEVIFGDVMAGNKSKMTPEQLQEVSQAEIRAIEIISQKYPKNVAGYSYKQLLVESENHSSLESQIMQYADKYDAMGDALHEMYAGNPYFIKHIKNEYGRIPTPIEYYTNYFANYLQKFPKMKPVLKSTLPIFSTMPNPDDYKAIVKSGRLHNAKSIKTPTGDTHYDAWLKIVLDCGNQETVRALYTQKEYLKT